MRWSWQQSKQQSTCQSYAPPVNEKLIVIKPMRLCVLLVPSYRGMVSHAESLGFVRRSIRVASGEVVPFLQRDLQGKNKDSNTLVVLHGLTSSKEKAIFQCGDRLLGGQQQQQQQHNDGDAIATHCGRVLIPDQRGHGERIPFAMKHQRTGGWSLAERAEDLTEFLKAVAEEDGDSGVADAQNIDIMGYSMGGALALKWAELGNVHRIRRAVLLAPAVRLTAESVLEHRQGVVRYAFASVPDAADYLEIVGASREVAAALAPVSAKMRELSHGIDGRPATSSELEAIRSFWERQWRGLVGADLAEPGGEGAASVPAGAAALAEARVPTLIVQSESDRVTDASGARLVAKAFYHSGGVVEVAAPVDVLHADAAAAGEAPLCTLLLHQHGYGHYLHPGSKASDGPVKNFLRPSYEAAARFLGFSLADGATAGHGRSGGSGNAVDASTPVHTTTRSKL